VGFDPLAIIRSESVALADAAAGNLTAPVEHCPGWTVRDLVRHVYTVHAFWGQVVEHRLQDPDRARDPDDVADDVLVDVFRAGAERFVGILAAADPAAAVWTWSDQHDVAFVVRHQVQEAAVHRWDAEHARGATGTLDAEPAADAVDEFLHVSARGAETRSDPLPVPIVLEATDAGSAWTIYPDGNRLGVRAGGGDGVRLRAPAFDLLLWLYDRLPASALDVDGDRDVLQRLQSYGADR
jgi:uncharacterized protein (TIGR03083 family)